MMAATVPSGEWNIDHDPMPSMGAEDFAFMLKERPSCYIWLGNGPAEGGCLLPNPAYDFNDADLAMVGAGVTGLSAAIDQRLRR